MRSAALVLCLLLHSAAGDSMTFTKTMTVTSGSTSKEASCSITVDYSAGSVDSAASSAACTINWPKNKALEEKVTVWVVVGELGGSLTNVKVKFTLSKKKNKNPSTTKTKSVTFTAQPYTSDDPASYPSDLWCPQEDVIIYTESGAVVNETQEADWQDCARLCSDYTNEAGNAPCFSWTYNNSPDSLYGLPAGTCRLLPYENVFRMEATGVQSGFHKCWFAYSTSVRP